MFYKKILFQSFYFTISYLRCLYNYVNVPVYIQVHILSTINELANQQLRMLQM